MVGTITPKSTTEARELPLAALRAQTTGAVYGPTDEGYDAARHAWNLMIQQLPAAIVMAETEADVQAAVRFAREHGLPIGVQSTGHGLPRGCDGGLLVNLAAMTATTVDPAAQTARLQGGAQWKHVLEPAGEHGLAGMCGSAPHVGVVGYTLGGGYGLLLRKYGLAIDAVLGMRVVTADGEVRVANRNENADLFWALLGGGGAFGVITEMEIRLFPQAQIFGGTVFYPIELAEAALTAFADWARDLPDEVTSSIALMNFPPIPMIPEPLRGKAVVAFTASVCAEEAEAVRLLAPMRTLGTPIIDAFTTMPFHACGAVFQDPVDPLPAIGNGVLLREFTPETVRPLLESVGEVGRMPHVKIELRHLGGAMARVAHGATAIGSRREAGYLMYCLGIPNPHATPEAMHAHSEAVFMNLGDAVLCRGPLNWIGEGRVRPEYVRSVFCDAAHARLTRTKQELDPENHFRFASVGIDA